MPILDSEVSQLVFWLRVCKSDHAPCRSQLPWLHPSPMHQLVWDGSMCADTTRVAALRCAGVAALREFAPPLLSDLARREAMSRAFRAPLVPAQQQQARE